MPLAWFGQREREVPSTLAAQLRGTLAKVSRGEATQIPDRLLEAGVALVTTVATAEPMTRDHALDLLTADALITYAFEAAAEEPEQLVARADAAMHRIAAVGS
jgi:hypothetical protein